MHSQQKPLLSTLIEAREAIHFVLFGQLFEPTIIGYDCDKQKALLGKLDAQIAALQATR